MLTKLLTIGLLVFTCWFGNLQADDITDFTGEDPPSNVLTIDDDEKNNAITAVRSIVFDIIELILQVVGMTGVIVITIGGFMYVINFGEDSLRDKAKDTIFYGIVGLLCVFLAYAAVENTIRYLYDDVKEDSYSKIDAPEKIDFVDEK